MEFSVKVTVRGIVIGGLVCLACGTFYLKVYLELLRQRDAWMYLATVVGYADAQNKQPITRADVLNLLSWPQDGRGWTGP
jgi:hypothetical protein